MIAEQTQRLQEEFYRLIGRTAAEPFYAPKRLSYVPSTATFALRFCTS
jgi:hypothetical protein